MFASSSAAADPLAAFAPADLLRLHAALTQRELWHALRLLARPIASASLTLDLHRVGDGAAVRVFRHGHPSTPQAVRVAHDPTREWLAANVGAPVFRLSDVVAARDLRRSPFYERVMRREGWDKQLAMVAWRGRIPHGVLSLYREPGTPDFSAKDLQAAAALQPHFDVALSRVMAHEERTFLGEHLAKSLDDAPVGLLLLDWELRPLWFNREGAHACAVWNHGERGGAALSPTRTFRVPAALSEACAQLRHEWDGSDAASNGPRPRVLSEDALGLHAQITLRAAGPNGILRPAFQIQLDYRRPRGDRNRPLSPGAVALLARLSAREREVAMRVREGLSTREIANELHRSPLTIKTQLAAIFRKLEVRSRTRVAALLNR